MKIIETTNISKRYIMGSEIIDALKSVTISVDKGEYVAFMGPSGSGKSTLMNILGCLDSPTAGTYNLNGHDVSAMTDDELAGIRNIEIGFVFQQFNLLPRLTAAENVALPLVYAGIPKKERLEKAFQAFKIIEKNNDLVVPNDCFFELTDSFLQLGENQINLYLLQKLYRKSIAKKDNATSIPDAKVTVLLSGWKLVTASLIQCTPSGMTSASDFSVSLIS